MLKAKLFFCFVLLAFFICKIQSYAADIVAIDFESDAVTFTAQPYWGGRVENKIDFSNAHGGQGFLELSPTKYKGVSYGRALYRPRLSNLSGRKYLYSAWVKGEGKLFLGVIKKIGKGKQQVIDWQENGIELTNAWEKVSFECDFGGIFVESVFLVIEIRENGNAFIDDVGFKECIDESICLKSLDEYQIFPLNTSDDINFYCSGVGKSISLFIEDEEHFRKQVIFQTVPENKIITIPADFLSSDIPCALKISAVCEGVSDSVFVSYITQDEYDKLSKIANNFRFDSPVHILFLGDSLSDYSRGHNYIDKIHFWMNFARSNQETYFNAGVAGDFITRVESRLKGDKTYRNEAYERIFERSPNLIFLFLGHNDTKLTKESDYKYPLIPVDLQKKSYQHVINYLKSKSDAEIVLISSTSSLDEICRANHLRLAKVGKISSLFGVPKHLEEFNATLQEICKENDLDFIDVYTPTKEACNKELLFNSSDGVHLTEQGNNFIAYIILSYLVALN